ncbi:MAG TPA: CpaF family protein [Pirellulaceae bacterium]|nr:CpaF family protein [Pirellulaceae bacterium]
MVGIATSKNGNGSSWRGGMAGDHGPGETPTQELHSRLIAGLDLSRIGSMSDEEIRAEIREAAADLCNRSSSLLTAGDRERLVAEVMDEAFGLGPLESLLRDATISDILVNGPQTVYVERKGRLELTDVTFGSEQHLLQIIQRIVGRVGRRVDETTPMVDARLADGSRVNAIIPPLALDGSLLCIRRFSAHALKADDLIAKQSVAKEMVEFLAGCVAARRNILISGGTGSGKTTLLNMLSGYIPHDERIATIEDAAELRLQQRHVVRMETRPANVEGQGLVTSRDLVRNALRMRPDRVVIGESRGPEALDMLQAMNTGHDGSMTTLHANDTRDALSRLEMMVGMAGFDMPMWVIRKQISSAVHIVVQAARLTGGVRKITKISEITGMEGEIISMHDLFVFKQTGLDADRVAEGYFVSTGIRPKCLEHLEIQGIHLPPEMFEGKTLTF